jgi:hypothetical protein
VRRTTRARVRALTSPRTLRGTAALAASASTSLHDVLAQLRRNAKVSERLNAGFFRAPQTRSFTGSAFRPTDDDTAFAVSTADGSLSLKPEQLSVVPPTTTTTTTTTTTSTTSSSTVTTAAQASGTFEVPLDIPNRAQVIRVKASYSDSKGNNTSPGGKLAPSGFNFEIVRFGQLGETAVEGQQPVPLRDAGDHHGRERGDKVLRLHAAIRDRKGSAGRAGLIHFRRRYARSTSR